MVLWPLTRHTGLVQVTPAGLSQGLGRSGCRLLWVAQSDFLSGLSRAHTGFLQVAPAERPWPRGGACAGCSGSHSLLFLIAWSETCARLLQFTPPQSGVPVGCPRGSVHTLVSWSEVCIGLLWIAGLYRGLLWTRQSCSGSHRQSSPVVLSKVCAMLLWLTPPGLG